MDHFGLKTLCWHCCCFLVSFLPCFWKKWIKSKPTVIAATATANKNPDWYPFPHLSMRTDQRTAGRSSTNLEQPTVTTFGPRQLAAKVFVKLPTPMTVGFRSVDLGLVHPFFLNHAEPKKRNRNGEILETWNMLLVCNVGVIVFIAFVFHPFYYLFSQLCLGFEHNYGQSIHFCTYTLNPSHSRKEFFTTNCASGDLELRTWQTVEPNVVREIKWETNVCCKNLCM